MPLDAKVPTDDGWIHELKHDGFRIIARKDGDDVRLWSRNGRDWSIEFVGITAAVTALPFGPTEKAPALQPGLLHSVRAGPRPKSAGLHFGHIASLRQLRLSA
jgi:hypothetical protein